MVYDILLQYNVILSLCQDILSAVSVFATHYKSSCEASVVFRQISD